MAQKCTAGGWKRVDILGIFFAVPWKRRLRSDGIVNKHQKLWTYVYKLVHSLSCEGDTTLVLQAYISSRMYFSSAWLGGKDLSFPHTPYMVHYSHSVRIKTQYVHVICIYLHTHTHLHLHLWVDFWANVGTYVYIIIYIYTYIHTYIYIIIIYSWPVVLNTCFFFPWHSNGLLVEPTLFVMAHQVGARLEDHLTVLVNGL